MSFINRIFDRLNWNDISIKNRLLAVFSLCLIISSLLSIGINIAIGLPLGANIVVIIITIIHALAFYFSIRNIISDQERCLYLAALVTFLPIAWIYNGGLVGSIPMYFFIYFTASIFSLTPNYRNYFITYILLLTILVLVIQTYFYEIIVPYSSLEAQIFDMKFAFIQVIIISIVITITFTSISDDIQLRIIKKKEKLEDSHFQLKVAKELAEKATLAKSNFITNISHEIRTPLNGIVGISDLLRSHSIDEEQKKLLQSLDLSTKTLMDLINDLLDLSKMEANKMILSNEIFEIRQTCKEINDLIYSQIKEKSINFKCIVDDNTPTFLSLDRTKYKQVLINLLSNAIKFTPQGNVCYSISYDTSTSTLTTTIEDSGIGIAEEHIDKLFIPFTQLNNSNNIENQGIGMGLTISKKLIDIMNGNIEVRSKIAKGSCFKFTVPSITINQHAIQKQKEDEKVRYQLLEEPKELDILIAEDHKINQIILAKMLEKLNHNYSIANNGQEAIDLCQQKEFDLILMDIKMPLIDGIEATKIIIDDCKTANKQIPKIVICSANVMQLENKELLANYITDYLIKPISLEQLRCSLKKSYMYKKEGF